MTVATLFPTLPPSIDGIGDYTALQATHLAARGVDTTILTAQTQWTALPGVHIQRAFPGGGRGVMAAVAAVAAAAPDWLLLQYNPLSYSGRFAANPYLPLFLARVKTASARTRIGLVLHEAYARFERLRLAPVWQRAQLYLMARHADLLLSTASTWCLPLQRWAPHARVAHLPVGSNMPRVARSQAEARRALGLAPDALVVGLFGSLGYGRRLAHVRAALRAAARAGEPVTLLYAGGDGAVLRALQTDEGTSLPLVDLGKCSHEQVSTALTAADVFVAPYRDGVSTRRGSFMAALQHGLPTVTTLGPSTDAVLHEHTNRAFCGVDEADPAAYEAAVHALLIDPERRRPLAREAAALYERSFDWPVTTTQLHALLSQ